MKKISVLISVILFILLIGSVGYFWVTASAGPSLESAENALADKHLIAFAHVDNKKINSIVNSVGSELKPSFLEDKSHLLKTLYFDAPRFKDNVYQAMYGLSYNQTDHKVTNSLLFHGLFSWKTIENTLKDHFTIKPLGDDKYKLHPKDMVSGDAFTCPDETAHKKPTSSYVYVSSDWVIFSDNLSQVDTLLSRMANKEVAEIDLKPWREYRSGKLASFALYNPEHIGKSIGGMSGHLAGGVYKKNTEIKSIFTSIDLSYLTPGIHLNSQVIANKEWATKYALEGKNKIAESKVAAKEYSPVLASLIDTLQVANDDDSLVVDFVVTQNDIEKIPDVINEAFSSVFSMSSGNADRKEDITAESINESPWDYINNQKLGSALTFKSGDFSGIPSLVNGPFAINIDKVSIGKKSGLIELDLKGLMSVGKIDGFWSNSKANLSLTVDSVTGVNQQELLKDERCDKNLPMFTTKNQKAVEGFNSNNDGHAYVGKTIRLIPNAQFNQIKEIEGSLRVHAPVSVSLVEIDFQKGKGFKGKALEFMITKTQQQTVTYKMKGKTENILEVRALNKNGQVLNFSQSFGNDNGKTASYRGDIDKLQLVIVDQWLDKKIDFKVKREDFLKGKPTQQYKINKLPHSANKKDLAAFSKAPLREITPDKIKKITYSSGAFIGSIEMSPVKLFVSHDYQSKWSFQPKLQVLMPLIEALAFNLQAVEMEIDVGQETPFKSFVNADTGHVINADKSIGEYKGRLKVGSFEYSLKQVNLKLPLESGEKLSNLKGNFIYHLPTKVQVVDIPFPDLGEMINVGGVKLTLTAIETGFSANYTFDVSGDELINIVAITEQGAFYPTQKNFEDGKWQLKYSLHPNIRSLRVLVSKEEEKVIKPFKIDINYGK
jgi:hypothetical protein